MNIIPTYTVIVPSTDQPFMGLRNVGRENALLQQMVPTTGSPDWRDLQHGQFTRVRIPGEKTGYLYVVRGDDDWKEN